LNLTAHTPKNKVLQVKWLDGSKKDKKKLIGVYKAKLTPLEMPVRPPNAEEINNNYLSF